MGEPAASCVCVAIRVQVTVLRFYPSSLASGWTSMGHSTSSWMVPTWVTEMACTELFKCSKRYARCWWRCLVATVAGGK